jgi:nitrite reductase/ring-hydroxylating ferredoxin subunit
MNRREFLGVSGCGLLVAGCGSLVTHAVTPVDGIVRLSPAAFPGLEKAGGSVRIQPAGYPEAIYVLRMDDEDGRAVYHAVSPICTHRGCTVEVRGAVLECPCHGSTYSRRGTVLRGPADRPLQTYQTTTTTEGLVEIRVGGTS